MKQYKIYLDLEFEAISETPQSALDIIIKEIQSIKCPFALLATRCYQIDEANQKKDDDFHTPTQEGTPHPRKPHE